jgi:hypothetical protein
MKIVSTAAALAACLIAHGAQAAAPVACSELRTMRELAPHLQLSTNPKTGHVVQYLVMGDAAHSDRVIVFFNGTSQVLPDWPTQLVSNGRSSPRIRSTDTFRRPRTDGVGFDAFVNQRNQAYDWGYAFCPFAGPSFNSLACSESQPVALSATNGGVCKTYSPAKPEFPINLPDEPIAPECVPLAIQGAITVINGPEDLYIQHVYGRALVKG